MNPKVLIQTMITLASLSLGYVAALAWNDAIKTTIKLLAKTEDDLAGLYIYAIISTIIAVVTLTILSKIASKLGKVDAAISREAEG